MKLDSYFVKFLRFGGLNVMGNRTDICSVNLFIVLFRNLL
jgi:hypothetical protein